MMFLGEADQILDLNGLAVIGDDLSGIAPEHLVYLTGDDAQVGPGQATGGVQIGSISFAGISISGKSS